MCVEALSTGAAVVSAEQMVPAVGTEDIPALIILRNCDCYLYGKGDSADMIKSRILRCGDYPG